MSNFPLNPDTNQHHTIDNIRWKFNGTAWNLVPEAVLSINGLTGTIDTSGLTFSFTNEPASGSAGTITLLITNGGANTTTWEAAVKWPGNVAPSLTSSGIDILSFITIDGGTTIYGFVGGINFS